MSGPQSAREFFDAALGQYLTKLVQVSNTLREHQQAAMRDYLEAASAASRNQGANSREYENLMAALRSQNADQIAAAHSAYLESLRKLETSVAEAAQSALNEYLAKIQSAWQEAQTESKAHCAAYIGEVKNVFLTTVSPDADSATLAAIGQNLITAAFYAAASMENAAGAEIPSKVQAHAS
jgi:hypothetical protein